MKPDSEHNEKLNLQTDSFDSLDNDHDCLTDAFERLLLWIKILFKCLWRVFIFTKQEFCYNRNEIINTKDALPMNNSAGGDYSYCKLPRHRSFIRQTDDRLSKNNSQPICDKSSSKLSMLSTKTRVTVRSISNQNLNRTDSNYASPSNTLGITNSHVMVAPVNSSVNFRERLADTLCRRSYEPLTFINRGRMCCGHCRPLIFPNVQFHHTSDHFPSITPQTKLNHAKMEQSPQIGDSSGTQSINSPIDEVLSIETISNNEQNYSILSFPEHDTPVSQKSEKLIDDETELKFNAQILVDDSIRNAQNKYQKILQMNTDQNLPNNTVATIKQIIKNKSKSALVSNDAKRDQLSDAHGLCRELCNKLHLSNSNQIAEIMRVLASNAPHTLKEQPPIGNSNVNKGNDNPLCNQLLLHPPFKPKRLINLCADGSIQVLSAVDENSNENQLDAQPQYRLNYSNSAVISSIEHNPLATNQPSLTLIMDNNSILSLQQEQTLFKYQNPSSIHMHEVPTHRDSIVGINLDLSDETTEERNEDEENSLPEIFFKRIIAPECSSPPIHENRHHHTGSRSSINKRSHSKKKSFNY